MLKTCSHVSNAIDNGSSRVVINEYIPINETADLPKSLTVCVSARVMLARNEDIEDKLIKGSTGTIMFLNGLRNSKLNGTIMFNLTIDLHELSFSGHLKKCVPIRANPQTFQWRNITLRQQFPLIIAFSTTIHKA